MKSSNKIGIFGGTFNPPHLGHLIVAESVRQQFELDKIIFIPAFISPFKNEGEDTLGTHRLVMTKLAVSHNIFFECSDIELVRENISYTYKTIKELKNKYPNDKLYLIVGMDNYQNFHMWKEPEQILKSVALLVLNRPNVEAVLNTNIDNSNVHFVSVPNIEISSSDIREKVKKGKSIRYLVTQEVEEYINKHTLYK